MILICADVCRNYYKNPRHVYLVAGKYDLMSKVNVRLYLDWTESDYVSSSDVLSSQFGFGSRPVRRPPWAMTPIMFYVFCLWNSARDGRALIQSSFLGE